MGTHGSPFLSLPTELIVTVLEGLHYDDLLTCTKVSPHVRVLGRKIVTCQQCLLCTGLPSLAHTYKGIHIAAVHTAA